MEPQKKQPRRTKTEVMNTNTNFGKVPPQATDLEEVVLGAMLLEKDKCVEVISQLEDVVFYKTQNQVVFRGIKAIYEKSRVDILTVTEYLRSTGELELAGGAYYISTLTNRVASSANIEEHTRIILQKWISRELIRISDQVIKTAYEDTTDVFELLEYTEQSILALTPEPQKSTSLFDISIKAMKLVMEASKTKTSGISTGYRELDYFTGLTPGDLFIIAARPGMGKTALALNIARSVAVDMPVGIFSLEMTDDQLYQRMVSSEMEAPLQSIKKGDLQPWEWERLTIIDNKIRQLPIQIDDCGTLSLFNLRVKARRWKSKHGIGLLILDYLQLMAGKQNGNREQEISSISRGLKALAKELDIPIIALSQLSRECEKRTDKIPQLSDLRESGSIEQDADEVLFLFRPGAYNIDADQEDCWPIIAKNRNGKTGGAKHLRFLGSYTKFVSYDNEPPADPLKNNYVTKEAF